MKKKLLNDFWESCLATYITLVTGYWAVYLIISTLLFIFKVPLAEYNLFASAVVIIPFSLWFAHHLQKEKFMVLFLSALALFIITFFPTIYISSKISDLSFDGQAYHQEAIIQFNRGWNPIYMTLKTEATANLERWLNHYPKATWVLSAGIYKLTNNIEAGKFFSLYAFFVAFAGSMWSIWNVKADVATKFLISLTLALNPVIIYQSLSYYVDGVWVAWLLLMTGILFKFAYDSYSGLKYKYLLWPYLFVVIVLINIKFTAFVLSLAVAVAFLSFLWISEKYSLALRIFVFSFVGFLIGGILVGFNPYITNTATFGHPFYPTMGKGAYDYVPGNTPQNYWPMKPPARFIHSIFSQSANVRGEGQSSNLKIPFTFSSNELNTFRVTSPKVGGFGPLFSGAFLLSFVLFTNYLLSPVITRKRKLAIAWVYLFILGISFTISTSSVARYVPYVWWLPVFTAFFFTVEKGVNLLLAQSILIILLVNSIMIVYAYVPYNIAQSQKLNKELQDLAKRQDKPLYVDVAQFGSTKLKLNNYGIRYWEVYKNTECKSRKRLLIENITEVCEVQ